MTTTSRANQEQQATTKASLEDGVGRADDEASDDVARHPEQDEVAPVLRLDDAVLAEGLGGGVEARQEEDDRVGHVPPEGPELVQGFLEADAARAVGNSCPLVPNPNPTRDSWLLVLRLLSVQIVAKGLAFFRPRVWERKEKTSGNAPFNNSRGSIGRQAPSVLELTRSVPLQAGAACEQASPTLGANNECGYLTTPVKFGFTG